jgi:hypothetical protein
MSSTESLNRKLPQSSPQRARSRVSPPARRWLFRAVFALFFLGLLWGVDWFAGWVYERLPAAMLGKQWVELASGRHAPEDRPWIPHPSMLYQNKPGWQGQICASGYRGPEPVKPVVLCIGGSTTYGHTVDDYHDSWPWQLGQQLGVETTNAGLQSSTSAEWLSGYVHRYRYLHAKVLVIHCGCNDATVFLYPDYDLEYVHYRHQDEKLSPRPGESALLAHSGLARLAYARWMNTGTVAPSWIPATPWYYLSAPQIHAHVQADQPLAYERNLDCLVKYALADGSRVLLSKIPLMSLDDFARTDPYAAAALPIQRELREAMRKTNAMTDRVGAKYSVPVIEAPQIPLRCYCDFVHMNAEGERIKAAVIAKAIRDHHLLEPAR